MAQRISPQHSLRAIISTNLQWFNGTPSSGCYERIPAGAIIHFQVTEAMGEQSGVKNCRGESGFTL